MDGSIFRTRLCPKCFRITWQPNLCRLCQKGAVTPA